MENIYLNFGGKEYYVDFEELDVFLFVDLEGREVSETEERVIYGVDGQPSGKDITTKTFTNEKEINGVRYELITGMIDTILMARDGDDGDDLLGAEVALDKMPFAYKLAFNTLIKYNIIKEVK